MNNTIENTDMNRDTLLTKFAMATAAFTLLLLAVGSIVTSKGVGMSVPDWPTTFGENMFTYPLSKMVGGIFYEHSHRLLGSLVGTLTIALTVLVWLRDSRKWLKWYTFGALLAVIVQGLLGGLRVVEIDQSIAVFHAGLAHAFFAMIVSIVYFLSNKWTEFVPATNSVELIKYRKFANITTAVIYVQLILGAFYRHTGALLHLHLLFAVVVTIMVFATSDKIRKDTKSNSTTVRFAKILNHGTLFQLVLGMGAYAFKLFAENPMQAPVSGIVVSVLHVINGSVILAAAVVMSLSLYDAKAQAGEAA